MVTGESGCAIGAVVVSLKMMDLVMVVMVEIIGRTGQWICDAWQWMVID